MTDHKLQSTWILELSRNLSEAVSLGGMKRKRFLGFFLGIAIVQLIIMQIAIGNKEQWNTSFIFTAVGRITRTSLSFPVTTEPST